MEMAILQTAVCTTWGGQAAKQEIKRNYFETYQRYHRECPTKLQHCRILKSSTSKEDKTVFAACQLQLRRPQNSTSNQVNVFIEWIACHPDYMNQGLGSTLLAWAADHAKRVVRANVLTLYVIRANTGAVRLYERRGFVIQRKQGSRPPSWCSRASDNVLGLLTCGVDRHWTVLTMEKDLTELNTSCAAEAVMDSVTVIVPQTQAATTVF